MKSVAPPRPSVFARVTAFSLECPHCCTLDVVRTGRRWGSPNFNPLTNRWICRACRRLFAVGLAVRPVSPTGNRSPKAVVPLDCLPQPDQRAALWQLQNRALVRKTAHRSGNPVNLLGCPCLDREDVDPDCPFHAGYQ
jgi:hypothetical protein